MISIASTKNVVTKGIRRVSQGQCVAIATSSAAVDKKNRIQYKPLDLLFISMSSILRKNRQEALIVRTDSNNFEPKLWKLFLCLCLLCA